jgi:hypothetical protein
MATTATNPKMKNTNPGEQYLLDFYGRREVDITSTSAKLAEIKREIGDKIFAAYGGDETQDMELAALEYELLIRDGIETPVEA